jgi:serine phosphatase RsbU (regulator of sigma subunit)/CheY-like chemotaxis protein
VFSSGAGMNSENFGNTVLLIDGSSNDTKDIMSLLIEEQYNVFKASSVEEALHVVEYIYPALVLINGSSLTRDINEICIQIRDATSRSIRNIPLIYLEPVNGEYKNNSASVKEVDACFPFPKFEEPALDQNVQSTGYSCITQLSNNHFLSLLRGHMNIRALKTSVEESHRQLSRAQRIMDRELSETAKMQRSFLPGIFPYHAELELAALYYPSIKVGGDYYDVNKIDDDHWGLVIADIAGHGTAAAVVMALTQMVVKEFGKGITSPQQALFKFNEKLNANLSSDHYVTMFYAVLNIQTMEMVYSHAGHVPLMHYLSVDDVIFDMKNEPSFPLRTFEMESYEERSIVLQPGDKILFFTDGVTDIQNKQNVFFGADRLRKVFLDNHQCSCEEMVQRIFNETESFRQDRDRMDDFTLMTLSRSAKT